MRFKAFFSGLFVVVLVTGVFSIAFGSDVKISVAADTPDRQAIISEVAGRANYFLFFDGKGTFLEAVENPFLSLRGGAGPKAAAFLANKGVIHVIAGDFGSKMEQALNSYHVKFTKQTGVSHEVVQAILETQ